MLFAAPHPHIPRPLTNDALHVVTMISNPVRYRSRYALYKEFEARVLAAGATLWTVEVAFGERPHAITQAGNPQHLQLRTSSELWHKENAINLGIARLPADWRYVAWVDADVQFARPDWAVETVQQLQHYACVQMFSECIDLASDYTTVPEEKGGERLPGMARQHLNGTAWGKKPYGAHPGHCLVGDSLVVPGGDVLAVSSRPYKGDLVIIRTASGKELSCSPDHPVLTDSGWLLAKAINVGDDVFQHVRGHGIAAEINKEHAPARIEDVVRAFSKRSTAVKTVCEVPDDFDDNRADQKITTVWTDSLLRDEGDSGFGHQNGNLPLGRVVDGAAQFSRLGSQNLFSKALNLSFAPDRPAVLGDGLSLFRGGFRQHAFADPSSNVGSLVGVAPAPITESSFAADLMRESFGGSRLSDLKWNAGVDDLPGVPFVHADDCSAFRRSLAGQIERDKVVFVGRREFDGHLYDLKTSRGYILSDSIVTHNCGYAWAMRRDAFDAVGGLIDFSACGANDHHMARGMIGNIVESVHHQSSPGLKCALAAWGERAKALRGNIGYVPGLALHYWHGSKAKRAYKDRWKILVDSQFDPAKDLRRDWQGLYQLHDDGTPRMTRLRDDLRSYLRSREEDSAS